MKILIADDDPTSRSLVGSVLRKLGHEPEEALDGLQAWEILQRTDAPRLVLLDWMMPGLEGPEVLRRVRALPLGSPPYILMLTSKTQRAELVEGLDAGADDYLAKPFDAEELRARIAVGCRMLDLQERLMGKITELSHALAEIKTLRGILPICAKCKKIRDDGGYWNQVEVYLHARTEAEFTHGLCPECSSELFPGIRKPVAP